ncbi:hypothetical protein GVAV_003058 [Gurleya vavrai]
MLINVNQVHLPCSFCHVPLIEYISCSFCHKKSHISCINSPKHNCISCQKCLEGECLTKLIKRVKPFSKNKILENKNLSFLKSIQNILKYDDNFLLEESIKLIEKQKGKFTVLNYKVYNNYSLNEILIIYSDHFTAWNVFGTIFWLKRCEVCNKGYHNKNIDSKVCNECLFCFNCHRSCIENEESDSYDDFKEFNNSVDLFIYFSNKENQHKRDFYIYKFKSYLNNLEVEKLLYCRECFIKFVESFELCPVCMKGYTQEDMLECELCFRWVHYECEPNKKIIKKSEANSDETPAYKCKACVYFENAWVGKELKFENEMLETKKIDNLKNLPCFLCNKEFNFNEEKIIEKVALKDTNNTIFVHKICALSNLRCQNGNFFVQKANKNCRKCKKPGAHVKCILCKKDEYLHFDCAFQAGECLFRSNIELPLCINHILEYIGKIYKLQYYADKIKFQIKNTKNIDYVRIDDYLIYQDVSFKKIFYSNTVNIFEFDYKNFYLNGNLMKQVDIEREFKKNNIKLTIEEMISEVDKICFDNKIEFDYPKKRINICLDEKYQKENFTFSFITHLIQTNKNLELKNSKIHGKGIFAKKLIYPNEVIINYDGQNISYAESDEREKKYKDADFYMFKTSEDVIDATLVGNLAKFINQSCDPNCFSTEAIWGTKRGILICAKRFITVGEELTYKYMMNGDKLICNCDAFNCKKTLN